MYSSPQDNSSKRPQYFHDDYIRIASISLSKRYLRVGLPVLIALLFIFDSHLRPIILSAMADAYINVGVFVAATLFIYYAAESYFGFDISKLQEKSAWQQITRAALLGALPGCGGAIIVVSQYAAGNMSFACLVAVLVATMGDAAFLLLAKSPETALLVISLGLGVGVLSGLVVHYLHSPEFMRQSTNKKTDILACNTRLPIPKVQMWLWVGLLVIALPLTLMSAFQVEVSVLNFFSFSGVAVDTSLVVGATAAVMCMLMWAILPLSTSYYRGLVAEDSVAVSSQDNLLQDSLSNNKKNRQTKTEEYHAQQAPMYQADTQQQFTQKQPAQNQCTQQGDFSQIAKRMIHDTNFIMVWVVMAFLLFEVFVHYTGASFTGLFTGALWLAPLIGVLVGFLPGCGPQIIVASLYLQGVVPLSTLIGNAISNDGDALFPALALAPKAAIVATIYSAIPALIVAYGVHYFIE